MTIKAVDRRRLIEVITVLCVLLIIAAVLFYHGVLWFNNPSKVDYPVRGVDVSVYQGEIDWPTLAAEGIQFAFIKATEGSSYRDEIFASNWQEASQTDLKIGAYHFFSYDSGGLTQAENFIATVPQSADALPPVVDIEFYGDKEKNPPAPEKTKAILNDLLEELEKYYGKKPIIYATKKSYDLYLKDGYKDYPIWIRDVTGFPSLADGRAWTFWQYSNRGRLNGFRGEEKYIDLNVFNGTSEEFRRFCRS